jgi:hypothetical protein
MTERAILSIVALIMLALTLKRGDKLSIVLTAGLTLGIVVTWAGLPTLTTVGLILYMLIGLVVSLYNLKNKELHQLNRTTIVVAGIFAFGASLFSLMHWPYAEEIRLSRIIPVVLYLVSLFNGMIKRKEIGYLTIMNIQFILSLIY